MYILNRKNQKVLLDISKVQKRIQDMADREPKLDIDVGAVIVDTVARIHTGVSSSEIDKKSAELAYSRQLTDIRYAELAARLIIDDHIRNIKFHIGRPHGPDIRNIEEISMLSVCKHLFNRINTSDMQQPLIDPTLLKVLIKYSDRVEAMIDYNREYQIGYNAYKILTSQFLLMYPNTKVSEIMQYNYMRVAIIIHYLGEYNRIHYGEPGCVNHSIRLYDNDRIFENANDIFIKYFGMDVLGKFRKRIRSGEYTWKDIFTAIRQMNNIDNTAEADCIELQHIIDRNCISWNDYLDRMPTPEISEIIWDRIRETYDIMSKNMFTHATPTMFNMGTPKPQGSSCFVIGPPLDSVEGIFKNWKLMCKYSKGSGGIGATHKSVRSRGAIINTTGQEANGLHAALHVADKAIMLVKQPKRNGVNAEYLTPLHPEFSNIIEARHPGSSDPMKIASLFTAVWIPDEFMMHVMREHAHRTQLTTTGGYSEVAIDELTSSWHQICPSNCDRLNNLNNQTRFNQAKEFDAIVSGDFGNNIIAACEHYKMHWSAEYYRLVRDHKYKTRVSAYKIWIQILALSGEIGLPYILYDDNVNRKNMQYYKIHSSNLCTEVLLHTNFMQTAVCNLGSVCLSEYVSSEPTPGTYTYFHEFMILGYSFKKKYYDYPRLERTVRMAVRNLDNIIDINHYITKESRRSNLLFRAIGIGVQALQELYYEFMLPYGSPEANRLFYFIMQFIYLIALDESAELAKQRGRFPEYAASQYARGKLHHDLWVAEGNKLMFPELLLPYFAGVREKIRVHGIRNSNLIAIAPTSTSSDRMNNTYSAEPRTSHLFNRVNQVGKNEFVTYRLFETLKELNLGNISDFADEIVNDRFNGIDNIKRIPEHIRQIFRTAWEISLEEQAANYLAGAPWTDQARSFIVFSAFPEIAQMNRFQFNLWRSGAKNGCYYLRRLTDSNAAKLQQKMAPVITSKLETTPEVPVTNNDSNPAICNRGDINCTGCG